MISTATIILVKYYPLESYGQNISLCTIHSVRQSGIAPVFVTFVILGLHFKVSIKERIRLLLDPPILQANLKKLCGKIQLSKNHDPEPTSSLWHPYFHSRKIHGEQNFATFVTMMTKFWSLSLNLLKFTERPLLLESGGRY